MAMTAAQIAAMNPGPVGLWRDSHHRYFFGDRGPLPSVTTIARVIDKSGPLVGWAKRETAACAIRNLDMLNQMVQQDGGKDAAETWLRGIPDYERDKSAEVGTAVHDLIHRYVLGEEVHPTDIEVPFMRAYRRAHEYLMTQRSGRLLLTEAMVVNLELGYGGTLDMGWELDGLPTLLDIKTGNRVYDEVAVQLAGYAEAPSTGTPDSPELTALPKWERFAILHLRPDAWSLIPVDVNEEARRAFRSALDLHNYLKGYAPWAQGMPITGVGQ
jgi:hypothetical protein